MKLIIILALALTSSNVVAEFVTPTDYSSTISDYRSPHHALIKNASSAQYVAGSPYNWGNGISGSESEWVSGRLNTFTFNLDDGYMINGVHLWDYTTYTPHDWMLTFYRDLNANGLQAGIHEFSLGSVCESRCSTYHKIDIPEFYDVQSITLTNTSHSQSSGVGLSELHFEGALQSLTSSSTQAVSSDVTAPAVLGLLALGLMGFSRRKIN
jgi:hypothetical protein